MGHDNDDVETMQLSREQVAFCFVLHRLVVVVATQIESSKLVVAAAKVVVDFVWVNVDLIVSRRCFIASSQVTWESIASTKRN